MSYPPVHIPCSARAHMERVRGAAQVLFGREYWKDVINWSALAKYGVVAQTDVDELLFTDEVEEAFTFITTQLESQLGAATFIVGDGD